jgi:hypothetical protein
LHATFFGLFYVVDFFLFVVLIFVTKLRRGTVTRLVKNAKRSYMAKLLKPSLSSKNLENVGLAEGKLDAGSILFAPEELISFYSIDAVVDLPSSEVPLKFVKLCHTTIDAFI